MILSTLSLTEGCRVMLSAVTRPGHHPWAALILCVYGQPILQPQWLGVWASRQSTPTPGTEAGVLASAGMCLSAPVCSDGVRREQAAPVVEQGSSPETRDWCPGADRSGGFQPG